MLPNENLPSARDQFREIDTVQGCWRGLGLTLALAAVLVAAPARAEDYPSRSIRLIVPYAAGGGADSVARIVAGRVAETIGQPIVIENRGGGGSIIGTELEEFRARRLHAAGRTIRADLDQPGGLPKPAL